VYELSDVRRMRGPSLSHAWVWCNEIDMMYASHMCLGSDKVELAPCLVCENRNVQHK
jgi:hypothetical protein